MSISPARSSLNRFLASAPLEGRVLDVGCGSARYTRNRPNTIRLDRVRTPQVHLLANALDLPFRDSSFDCVLYTELLEHLPDPARGVQELHRVLRPGGSCVLTTRFCYPIHGEPHDYFRFTEYALRSLFREFDIECLVPDTDSLSTIVQCLHSFSAERNESPGMRLLGVVLLSVSRLYFRLFARFGKSPTQARLPSGYHLLARKK